MALRSHIVTKSSHTYDCRWSPSDVGGADMTGRAGKTRNIWLVWLGWPVITLGGYSVVLWYKIKREGRGFDETLEVNRVLSVVAVTIGWIIIVPPYVSIYNTGLRIARMQKGAGSQPSCNPWIG